MFQYNFLSCSSVFLSLLIPFFPFYFYFDLLFFFPVASCCLSYCLFFLITNFQIINKTFFWKGLLYQRSADAVARLRRRSFERWAFQPPSPLFLDRNGKKRGGKRRSAVAKTEKRQQPPVRKENFAAFLASVCLRGARYNRRGRAIGKRTKDMKKVKTCSFSVVYSPPFTYFGFLLQSCFLFAFFFLCGSIIFFLLNSVFLVLCLFLLFYLPLFL